MAYAADPPAATDPEPTDIEKKKEAAEAAKAEAEARKADAEARKAEIETDLAALKARIGEVPTSGYAGDVTLRDKAGVTEAALLATRALGEAAKHISTSIQEETAGKNVLLYSATEIPTFQALSVFRAQVVWIETSFERSKRDSDNANAQAPPPTEPRVEMGFVGPAAALGLGADAINKLFGFFRTDYTFGSVDLELGDSLLAHELAGVLKAKTVQLPAAYNPGALSDSGKGVLNQIDGLVRLRVSADEGADRHGKASKEFADQAENEKRDQKKRQELIKNATIHKNAADSWRSFIAIYDGFLGKLTGPDDKGHVPLATVIREDVVARALAAGDLLLLVKLHTAGGAYYTKKNLWSWFGRTPFFHMGGVVVSYVLFDGATGAVMDADTIPVHGGFVRAVELQKQIRYPN